MVVLASLVTHVPVRVGGLAHDAQHVSFFYGFIIEIYIVVCLFIAWCSPSCSNGVCVAGNGCSCPSGYSGTRCQTGMIDWFLIHKRWERENVGSNLNMSSSILLLWKECCSFGQRWKTSYRRSESGWSSLVNQSFDEWTCTRWNHSHDAQWT